MEPLQPMRPVDVQRVEREAAPRWKVWGAYIGGPALYLASMWIDGGHEWAVVAGVCLFVVGAALSVAAARRVSRENAGRRIPWMGLPPVRPRKVDLLETVGASMALSGALLAANNLSIPWPISLPIIACVLIGAPLAAQAWHNYRVRKSTPNP
ncbi:hypothetical protein KZO37_08785 [Rhodococcus fascians]|uniref:hypothetical protein n=1 Tax=Nocardiaceae TaxID=85025 RepID=UPI0019D0F77A|nr:MULTISPECIES: hypothetical protein [Rhodococcus]MBW4779459.1 hypothetical protein [Rhodococcus fascians]MDJ0002009.1 hypothetical protein [Rhodococcus fascians]